MTQVVTMEGQGVSKSQTHREVAQAKARFRLRRSQPMKGFPKLVYFLDCYIGFYRVQGFRKLGVVFSFLEVPIIRNITFCRVKNWSPPILANCPMKKRCNGQNKVKRGRASLFTYSEPRSLFRPTVPLPDISF